MPPHHSINNCESLCNNCVSAAQGCFNTPKAPLPSACESYAGAASACAGRRRSYA